MTDTTLVALSLVVQELVRERREHDDTRGRYTDLKAQLTVERGESERRFQAIQTMTRLMEQVQAERDRALGTVQMYRDSLGDQVTSDVKTAQGGVTATVSLEELCGRCGQTFGKHLGQRCPRMDASKTFRPMYDVSKNR